MKESKADWIEDKCPACNGTGFDTVVKPVRLGDKKISPPPCASCGGTGRKKKATK